MADITDAEVALLNARADADRLARALKLARGNLDMQWEASSIIHWMAADALARHEGEKRDV